MKAAMTATFFLALILMLAALLVRWMTSAPLVRTLSSAIDTWAEEQHSVLSWGQDRPAIGQGKDAEQLR